MPPPRGRSDRPSSRPAARPSSDAPARGRRIDRTSGVQSTNPDMPAATVDEVTADLSNDPRRERDDDEDDKEKE